MNFYMPKKFLYILIAIFIISVAGIFVLFLRQYLQIGVELQGTQKQEESKPYTPQAGRVESVSAADRSFIFREGVVAPGEKTFTVVAGGNTVIVRIIYPKGYDPRNISPGSGVEIRQMPATFSDIRVGDIVYVRIPRPITGSVIENPKIIEIQQEG